MFFLGNWGSSRNWLEPKTKPPLQILVGPKQWCALYSSEMVRGKRSKIWRNLRQLYGYNIVYSTDLKIHKNNYHKIYNTHLSNILLKIFLQKRDISYQLGIKKVKSAYRIWKKWLLNLNNLTKPFHCQINKSSQNIKSCWKLVINYKQNWLWRTLRNHRNMFVTTLTSL